MTLALAFEIDKGVVMGPEEASGLAFSFSFAFSFPTAFHVATEPPNRLVGEASPSLLGAAVLHVDVLSGLGGGHVVNAGVRDVFCAGIR